MREVDKKAIEGLEVPSLHLMENAAKAVVKSILENFSSSFLYGGILVAAGKGNNGGDGIAAARILKSIGFSPRVFVFGKKEELSDDAKIQVERYSPAGEITFVSDNQGSYLFETALKRSPLIIDALLGTGTRGAVSGVILDVIEKINSSAGAKVSIDIPSGLSGDSFALPGPCVKADLTVTLGAPKPPLLSPECEDVVGNLVVADIGLPDEALNSVKAKGGALDLRWASSFFIERDRTTHKGGMGHLLVIAGSQGKFGAAVLSAMGALRAGAGLLTVAVSSEFAPLLSSSLPEVMTLPLPSAGSGAVSSKALDIVLSFLKNVDAVAMGPGLGTHPETAAFVRELYKAVKKPMVIDADAINIFDNNESLLSFHAGERVLTPHPGELGRILKLTPKEVAEKRYTLCIEKAREWNVDLLVKGYRSFMAAGDGRWRINLSGGPHMAAPGMGDVLTGIIGALLARGLEPFDAMALGAFWHGAAADSAFLKSGYGILASEVSQNLPFVEAEGRNLWK
jgi:ADP-dependent NAD(P)H-hydrate dehydratase / NAD(P)H-hydrate epimerase